MSGTGGFWAGLGKVEQMAPAIYRDGYGHLHLELGRWLRQIGEDDTPENRLDLAARLTRELRSLQRPRVPHRG